jgi:ribonuclease BN (tRNA processing enzyme)
MKRNFRGGANPSAGLLVGVFLVAGFPARSAGSLDGDATATGAVAKEVVGTAPITRVVLLGTEGGPTATKFRSEPANLLVVDGTAYLIDAGAGVSRQLPWAGYDPVDIGTIFITHHHVDHNAGLVSLMSLAWFVRSWGNLDKPPVQIYGPPSTSHLVHAALDYLSVSERIFRAGVPAMKRAAPMFVAHDIVQDGVVYQDSHVRVTAVTNTHFRSPSQSEDKQLDRAFSYRFDTESGSVVFTGDTGPSDRVTELARDADVLVSEVCVEEMCGPGAHAAKSMPPEMARQEEFHFINEHLTPEEVGKMAAAAHVKLVLLSHLVSSLDSDDALTDVSVFVSGVKKFYAGPVLVGRDLFEYDILRSPSGH